MSDIRIRAYVAQDVEALAEAVRGSLPELSAYLPWAHADYGLEDARQWIAFCQDCWLRGSEYPMGIFNAGGALLGGIGLNKINVQARTANLGYWVRSDVTGQGIATEAARQMVAYAFDELGFRYLEIVILPANPASLRVASKIGAADRGIARGRVVLHGVSHDARLFSIEAPRV